MKTKNTIKYFISAIILTLALTVGVIPALASQITPKSVLKLINQERTKKGLNELEENSQLMKVAQDKLNDMIENHYFAHTSPQGVTPWSWYEKDGYDYQYAGENLAINFLSAENQNEAWMKSPEHKKNILNPHYLQTGIAVGVGEVDGQNSIITVEEFGSLVGAVANVTTKKKVSGEKKANLIQEENKIVPQVLSVKDTVLKKVDNSLQSKIEKQNNLSWWKSFSQNYQIHKVAIINYITSIMVLVLLSVIALIPIVFLSVSFEDIELIWRSD
jgi:hypothetical protein